MPTPFTSTFASAAASNDTDTTSTRREGSGAGDWSRSRMNGATQTFRRPSSTTTHSQARESTQSGPNSSAAGVYVPPHLNSNYPAAGQRNGIAGDTRYNKEQLLGIFQYQKERGILNRNLEEVFLGSWNPLETKNGAKLRGEAKDQSSDPEVCWNHSSDVDPFGLVGMTEEEIQLFSASVNSPIKMGQSGAKEGSSAGVIGTRKPSLSGNHNSSNNSRSGGRRREPSESYTANGPLSPSETKSFFRNEPNTATPPSALLRRRTDLRDEDTNPDEKELPVDAEEATDSQTSFAPLRRAGTAPMNAGLNSSPSSPWPSAPQSSGFGSMGSFGSFAIGSSSSGQEPAEKRPGFGSARGSSRFKDLLTKNSSEDMGTNKDKGVFGALEKLPEEDADNAQARLQEIFKTRPSRSETNPYEDAQPRSGSASVNTTQDTIASNQGIEHLGFSSFAGGSNSMSRDIGHGDVPTHNTPYARVNKQDQMSPTNTNPYQSPQGVPTEDSERATSSANAQPNTASAFATNRRSLFGASEDRNGPSNPAPQRNSSGFGGASGFGAIGVSPNWPSSSSNNNTSARDRTLGASTFGDPIFSPLPDLQSPSTTGSGAGFFGSGGFGSVGRSGRLGAMFPPAMQEQMRGDSLGELPNPPFEARPDNNSVRDPFGNTNRRAEDSLLRSSGAFEDFETARGMDDSAQQFGQTSQPGISNVPSAPGLGQRASTGTDHGQPGHGLSQSSGSSSSNQMPAAQQRQMVMPDRMRWIYRDPQGNTQGPWSGLEMHDWFKAGFFTAELQVKKLEDGEYEPLAQLVRRIGNSREPFLVPQIGVPHGQSGSGQSTHWANSAMGGAGPPGGAQPPFANSFPSFGTTLTAEQQNALERRKQEEQFLMARQKEHLAQQQVLMKQMQMQNGPHGMHSLQHHSSAHSLQSQPSFGSMTSPPGYQATPMQGPIQPPHNGQVYGQQHAGSNMAPQQQYGGESRPSREEDLQNSMSGMSFSQRANYPFGMAPLPTSGDHPTSNAQQATSMPQDRGRPQQYQHQQADLRSHQDIFLGQHGQNDRLDEFNKLRGPVESQSANAKFDPNYIQYPEMSPRGTGNDLEMLQQNQLASMGHVGAIQRPQIPEEEENLSLAQQVLRTTAANQQSASETGLYRPDGTSTQPPPTSISPLPAPAAQRNRQHVADALTAESRSTVQTPVETPGTSIAPWAERSVELPKGPSLREIQEAEAKRAAEQEEIAAANARRIQAEQERLSQTQAPPPAPGLPSTSTWGASASPGSVTPTGSVWSKQGTTKSVGSTGSASAKKTLAQIQKEEENRKQRAVAAATLAAQTQTATSQASNSVGKRYAELAGKVAPATPTSSNTAWTTVGSGGKVKPPTTVIATPQTATRSVSTTSTTSTKTRPTLPTARSTISGNQSKANEEFTKWIKGALGKGLNSNINLDNFTQDLLMLPPEIEIISDSVYASSQTLDGRRFAEEFVRRRKLADKGVIEPATNGPQAMTGSESKSTGGGGIGGSGWNEVAKKGPTSTKEESGNSSSSAPFKVVSTKKKGKR